MCAPTHTSKPINRSISQSVTSIDQCTPPLPPALNPPHPTHLEPVHAEAVAQLRIILPRVCCQRRRPQRAQHALAPGPDDAPLLLWIVCVWIWMTVSLAIAGSPKSAPIRESIYPSIQHHTTQHHPTTTTDSHQAHSSIQSKYNTTHHTATPHHTTQRRQTTYIRALAPAPRLPRRRVRGAKVPRGPRVQHHARPDVVVGGAAVLQYHHRGARAFVQAQGHAGGAVCVCVCGGGVESLGRWVCLSVCLSCLSVCLSVSPPTEGAVGCVYTYLPLHMMCVYKSPSAHPPIHPFIQRATTSPSSSFLLPPSSSPLIYPPTRGWRA
jgi:hypothetical protein